MHIEVPVVDVRMQQVEIPILPPLPQLAPPPSLDDVLSMLDMALPDFGAPGPEHMYAGVPPMPPLDFAALLNPLSSTLDLLGSGVLEDIQTLSQPETASGAQQYAGTAAAQSADSAGSAAGLPGGAALADHALAVPDGHPLSKLTALDQSLLATIERGQRALRELERAWESNASTQTVAKGEDLERAKRELREQGQTISLLTKQGAAIIASGRTQLQLVAARLQMQLAALAAGAWTPWGQAAIVAAIAAATAEAEAIIASTEAQLVPLTQQMMQAAAPVQVPPPPVPMQQVLAALDQILTKMSEFLRPSQPRVEPQLFAAASAAPTPRSQEVLDRQIPSTGQQYSSPYAALTGSQTTRTRAALNLAKAAVDFFHSQFPSPAGHGAVPYAGTSALAAPHEGPARAKPSEPAQGSPSSILAARPTVNAAPHPTSASSSGSGHRSSKDLPTAAGVETALPTFTAAATAPSTSPGLPAGAGGAAAALQSGAAAARPGTMGGSNGMMPMAPMAPMGAAGVGGGGENRKLPNYLISAANGEELFGEQFNVAPTVIGGQPHPGGSAESGDDVDTRNINL